MFEPGRKRNAREVLKKRDPAMLEDRLMRSYGQLSNARIMSSKEFMGRCSDLRLAACMGYIDIALSFIDALMMDAQDGSLSVNAEGELTERELNIRRANYIRSKLG